MCYITFCLFKQMEFFKGGGGVKWSCPHPPLDFHILLFLEMFEFLSDIFVCLTLFISVSLLCLSSTQYEHISVTICLSYYLYLSSICLSIYISAICACLSQVYLIIHLYQGIQLSNNISICLFNISIVHLCIFLCLSEYISGYTSV